MTERSQCHFELMTVLPHRHSLYTVELSHRSVKPCANCVYSSRPSNGGPIYRCGGSRSCGFTGWLGLLLIKAGDVETNPGSTTTPKKVWNCYIYHRQIHVRKPISIRCNRIEHCVHLRCVGIRLTQYTAWTWHLHKESRLTTQTDITPPSQTLDQATHQQPHRH